MTFRAFVKKFRAGGWAVGGGAGRAWVGEAQSTRSACKIFMLSLAFLLFCSAAARAEQECFSYTINSTNCTPPCFIPNAAGRPIQTSYLQYSIITDVQAASTYSGTLEVKSGESNFQTYPGMVAVAADKAEFFNGPFQYLRLNVQTMTGTTIVGFCGVN